MKPFFEFDPFNRQRRLLRQPSVEQFYAPPPSHDRQGFGKSDAGRSLPRRISPNQELWREGRRNFITEAALFLGLAITAFIALLICASQLAAFLTATSAN